jgi:hypothetical protein
MYIAWKVGFNSKVDWGQQQHLTLKGYHSRLSYFNALGMYQMVPPISTKVKLKLQSKPRGKPTRVQDPG